MIPGTNELRNEEMPEFNPAFMKNSFSQIEGSVTDSINRSLN